MMLTPEQAVLASILVCIGGALLALVLSGHRTVAGWLTFLVTSSTAILIGLGVFRVLLNGPSAHAATFWAVPKAGFALRIYVDGLSAVFLLLACIIAVPAALYSIAYMRHYPGYSAARYYPYFLLFLAAMYGLLSTTDMMWFFFIFWQLMTLPGYALIRFEYKKEENISAANKYLIMMQIACVVTMVGAELLASNGQSINSGSNVHYDFDTVSATLPILLRTRPLLSALAFALFLAGFGIKMGMWPFGQVWLPDAHPAAPSPVSAMLSGVMIKTGVYGLVRYFLWLVPLSAQKDYPLAHWGMLIAILGTITLFSGTMQALKQEQSKRLLAFHSIGQIGYILLGVGTCMALLPRSNPAAVALAALALTGALLHVLNHGLFKGLLFLNAGSILHATSTQDLNRLGGLMRFMPLTAVTAMIASFAISGAPLLNGFVSKWTIYAAAVQGSASAHYLAVCAVVAILTSALTLASFIKFFGLSFLSRTSALVKQESEKHVLEVPWLMQVPQLFLAFGCVLLGVIPAIGFRYMQLALAGSRQGFGTALANAAPVTVGLARGVEQATARFSPIALLVVLILLLLLAHRISRLGGAPRRKAAAWLCGYAVEGESNRYIAHNFYGEIKRYFYWLGGTPQPTKR